MLDMRLAAARCEDAARAAAYLRHAADEERHARMLERLANTWAARVGGEAERPVAADFEGLYDRLGEERFLAFVHRGEGRATRQFEAYRAHFEARGEPRTAAVFARLIKDERFHEAYTGELLEELAGSPEAARAALRRVAWWEAWRRYRRAGRALAGLLYQGSMAALYLTLAPLMLLIRLVRPVRRGWLPPDA